MSAPNNNVIEGRACVYDLYINQKKFLKETIEAFEKSELDVNDKITALNNLASALFKTEPTKQDQALAFFNYKVGITKTVDKPEEQKKGAIRNVVNKFINYVKAPAAPKQIEENQLSALLRKIKTEKFLSLDEKKEKKEKKEKEKEIAEKIKSENLEKETGILPGSSLKQTPESSNPSSLSDEKESTKGLDQSVTDKSKDQSTLKEQTNNSKPVETSKKDLPKDNSSTTDKSKIDGSGKSETGEIPVESTLTDKEVTGSDHPDTSKTKEKKVSDSKGSDSIEPKKGIKKEKETSDPLEVEVSESPQENNNQEQKKTSCFKRFLECLFCPCINFFKFLQKCCGKKKVDEETES